MIRIKGTLGNWNQFSPQEIPDKKHVDTLATWQVLPINFDRNHICTEVDLLNARSKSEMSSSEHALEMGTLFSKSLISFRIQIMVLPIVCWLMPSNAFLLEMFSPLPGLFFTTNFTVANSMIHPDLHCLGMSMAFF